MYTHVIHKYMYTRFIRRLAAGRQQAGRQAAGQAQARHRPATAPPLHSSGQAPPRHSTLEVVRGNPPQATHFPIENENGLASKPGTPLPPSVNSLCKVK